MRTFWYRRGHVKQNKMSLQAHLHKHSGNWKQNQGLLGGIQENPKMMFKSEQNAKGGYRVL